jgi:hypothetical protein
MATRAQEVTFAIDVDGVEPNAVTVDALAQLQLAARRIGGRVVLRNASQELLELVTFMGLAGILVDDRRALRLEPSRQSEEREERRRVQEERQLDDPAVRDLKHL